MFHLIPLIVLVLAFFSHEHEVVATLWEPTEEWIPPLNAPITKRTGAVQDLYSVEINTDWANGQYMHLDFLIDTDARLVWRECVVQLPISTEKCPIDTLCNTYMPSPPCNVENPVTGGCLQVKTFYDDFMVNLSNGKHILSGAYDASMIAGCAPSSALVSFPKNVTGVMALSRSPYAFPAQVAGIRKNILGLCLPSTTSARGVLQIGESPFYLLPHSDVDVTSFLSYTPLYTQPESFGYFIVVNAIVIKKRSTNLPMNTKAKISTTDRYTTLRTDIYNRMVQSFTKVTKQIPRATPVPPFSLCFRTFTNGTKAVLKVPDINLSLEGGKNWTISTLNSIKQITKDVACLAFADGGAKSESAIVIGTFQFQDNYIVFDADNARFGFSSSLLPKKTSCSNFNFTQTSDVF